MSNINIIRILKRYGTWYARECHPVTQLRSTQSKQLSCRGEHFRQRTAQRGCMPARTPSILCLRLCLFMTLMLLCSLISLWFSSIAGPGLRHCGSQLVHPSRSKIHWKRQKQAGGSYTPTTHYPLHTHTCFFFPQTRG